MAAAHGQMVVSCLDLGPLVSLPMLASHSVPITRSTWPSWAKFAMEQAVSMFQPPQMAAKRSICQPLFLVRRQARFLVISRGSLLIRRRDHTVGIFMLSGPTIITATADMAIIVVKNWPFRAPL